MDSSSSWIDVETSDQPAVQDWCPIPAFRPNLTGPLPACLPTAPDMDVPGHAAFRPGMDVPGHAAFRPGEAEAKAELHRVLNSVQCSADFGIYFCESFRDPRRHYIDDYWKEIRHESIGIEELHKTIGKSDGSPLADETRARLHRLARLFERLARRIDRVVLA
jgi:hypothetical protein